MRFYDTAGIRNSRNAIEKIGIERSRFIAKQADINLIFLDKIHEIKYFSDIKNPLFVQSKQDIRRKPIKNRKIHLISSTTGEGINKLLSKIYKKLYNSEQKTNLLILCVLNNVIDKTTSNVIVSVKIAVVVIVNMSAIKDKINQKY